MELKGGDGQAGPGTDLLDTAQARSAFQRALLEWYHSRRRDLSWRASTDPYRVWISEIMLQQTRVEQVEGYFQRFVARFPTVAELAAAQEGEVLKAWEGLGYYARARNLHRAARRIVREYGGRLPSTRKELAALPGVGPYTSAAVASIAFARDHAALDGNAIRVLCRVLEETEDPQRSATRARLEEAAQRLLPAGKAGDFNQAMMELGARVCTPRKPGCGACPVRRYCRALAQMEDPAELPVRRTRRSGPHYQVAAGIIWRGDLVLIAQRPSGGMLGGLWEFPGGKQEPGESLQECLAREIREELDIAIEVREHLVSVDHAYTHFSITLHAFRALYVTGQPRALACSDWRWIHWEQLHEFAFPRTDGKIIEYLEASAAGGGERDRR